VAYAALEESIRLLDGAPPSEVARLSRRVRHVALAVDRDGRVAATIFLRRGASGAPCLDTHGLELADTDWRLLGGGGGSGQVVLTARPQLKTLGAAAVELGRGGVRRHADRLAPGESGWVRWFQVRAAVEVASLQVNERLLPVHDHGVAIVVWGTERLPHVAALSADGSRLGPIQFHDSPATGCSDTVLSASDDPRPDSMPDGAVNRVNSGHSRTS
jgi:hypothetical protein